MLKLKLKEIIQMQGKRTPSTWLTKTCGVGRGKASLLLENKQKSITFEDLSNICYQLQCTPNDIFYWHQTAANPIENTHPLAQLQPPDGAAEWKNIFLSLNPSELSEIRNLALKKIKDKKDKK